MGISIIVTTIHTTMATTDQSPSCFSFYVVCVRALVSVLRAFDMLDMITEDGLSTIGKMVITQDESFPE